MTPNPVVPGYCVLAAVPEKLKECLKAGVLRHSKDKADPPNPGPLLMKLGSFLVVVSLPQPSSRLASHCSTSVFGTRSVKRFHRGIGSSRANVGAFLGPARPALPTLVDGEGCGRDDSDPISTISNDRRLERWPIDFVRFTCNRS